MTRSVEDLELSCRVLFGAPGPISDTIPPVPFVEATIPEKLRFGYYTSGGPFNVLDFFTSEVLLRWPCKGISGVQARRPRNS